jgi:hypothetical protein
LAERLQHSPLYRRSFWLTGRVSCNAHGRRSYAHGVNAGYPSDTTVNLSTRDALL